MGMVDMVESSRTSYIEVITIFYMLHFFHQLLSYCFCYLLVKTASELVFLPFETESGLKLKLGAKKG